MHKIVAFKKPVAPAPDVPMQGHVIRNFTPNWFATTMGTGILSVALAQFPGHPWLFAIGQARKSLVDLRPSASLRGERTVAFDPLAYRIE